MSKSPSMAQVYIFEAETGLIKIGYTIHPEQRAKKLETSSGFKIKQQSVSPPCFNYREIEKSLHKQFAEYRRQGEWFAMDFQVAIDALNQQKFETSSAPSTQLVAFQFEQNEVRTFIDEKGDPWFVAKDVCQALGIAWKGISGTLKNIPENWRGVWRFQTPLENQYGKYGKTEQEFIVINESALYKLAFRSNKPEADKFVNWVVGEVLPAIRKTGKYEVNPPLPTLTRRPEYQDFDNFVAECFIADSAGLVAARDIYTAYKEWCQRHQRTLYTHKLLGQYLKELGYTPVKRTHGKYCWLGIRLQLQLDVTSLESRSHSLFDEAKIVDLQDYLGALCQILESDEQYKRWLVLLKTAIEKAKTLK
jgi:prophage antirepressor-like protein